MRYVLCSIDRETGSAAVLGGTTFETVTDATDALMGGRITAPAGSDVRLVDLDAATPVLVVAVGPAPVTADAPERAFEAPAPEAEVEPEPEVAPAVAPEVEGDVEDDTVPPAAEPTAEMVPAEPVGLTWQAAPAPETADEANAPFDDYAEPLASREVEVATWSFAAEDGAAVGPSLTGPDRDADDIARSELWWAEVGAEDLPAAEIAPPAEPTRALAFEDAALVAEFGALAGQPGPEEEPADETVATQEPLADIAESPSELEAGDLPADPADLWSAAAEQDVAEEQPEVRFARIDFDAWSCIDCVFTATCPRNGTDRPATCGSFQWRAE